MYPEMVVTMKDVHTVKVMAKLSASGGENGETVDDIPRLEPGKPPTSKGP